MIIDASVAFKWLVEEPDSYVAISWLSLDGLKAPPIIYAEAGNALAKRIRGHELKADGAADNLLRLARMLSIIDDQPHLGRALDMAIALDHSFYDCLYLAIGEALGEQLLTADTKFAAKCATSEWAALVHPWQAYR
jgi:predicted nucleic acid-binding protein